MKINRIHINELLVAFYINSFVILKPLLNKYSYVSDTILGVELAIILIIYLISSKFILNKNRMLEMVKLFCFVTTIVLFDYIFRRTELTWNYYYYFLIYGMITVFLLINVKDYDFLLKYWCIFAFLGGIILFLDPINRYAITGDYMNFGVCILPAFIASVIGYKYYNKKILLVFIFLFLLEIILYSNKGASISAISIIIFMIIVYTENKKRKIEIIFFTIIISLLLFVYMPNIIDILSDLASNLASKFGVGSYALNGFKAIISNADNNIFSIRIDIWENAITEIKNNLVLGMGIGTFEIKYGNYAHNFVLDVLVSHGVIIGSCIFYYTYVYIRNIFRFKDKNIFLFSSIALLLWFMPLAFSFTFWNSIYFWVFVSFGICMKSKIIN